MPEENGDFRRRTDVEISGIKKDLKNINGKVNEVAENVKLLLEQRYQVEENKKSTEAMWKEFRKLTAVDGLLHRIQSFQESCPREDIREFMKETTKAMQEMSKCFAKKEELKEFEINMKEDNAKARKWQWAIIVVTIGSFTTLLAILLRANMV